MERIADDAAALLDHLDGRPGRRVRAVDGRLRGLRVGAPPRRPVARPGAGRHEGAGATRRRRGSAGPRWRRRSARGRVRPRRTRSCRSCWARPRKRERPQVVGSRARDDPGATRRAASRTRWPASPRAPTRRADTARDPRADARRVRRGGRAHAAVRRGGDPARASRAAGWSCSRARDTSPTWRTRTAFNRALARIPGGALARDPESHRFQGALGGRVAPGEREAVDVDDAVQSAPAPARGRAAAGGPAPPPGRAWPRRRPAGSPPAHPARPRRAAARARRSCARPCSC